MAQPSVASYFCTRKRTAIDDLKVIKARKAETAQLEPVNKAKKAIFTEKNKQVEAPVQLDNCELNAKIVNPKNEPKTKQGAAKKAPSKKKTKEASIRGDIQELFNRMNGKEGEALKEIVVNESTAPKDPVELLKTPPATPTKSTNAMDKIKTAGRELNFNQLKHKLTRSNRLAELKASMARFNESAKKLEQIEQKTASIEQNTNAAAASPSLKNFKSIELEVMLSPKKVQSPEKAYLSPRKDTTTVRRNLLSSLTPTKNAISIPQSPNKHQLFSPQKASLTLPYKYRTLSELFRSVDTVCQILHNRNERITYRKLKPAVEELLKRNLQEKHLAQIKTLYPNAYTFKQEKLRLYGTGTKHEQWELVIDPAIDGQEIMSSDIILERRRTMHNTLLEKVKTYHEEFLLDLDPPMIIAKHKITRWHPEFDLEKVPEVELAELPQPPHEEKFTTGKDVLEKARAMFNCNTRMEQALERLKNAQESNTEIVPEKPKEVPLQLRGIPKALLEKIQQKQAAKAMCTMTRSDDKEKEVQLYSRLPELARVMRNVFVAEKKSVLPSDTVLQKLGNSVRSFMPKTELEEHVRALEKEVPGWIVFHNIRNSIFIKMNKNTDLSLVINKLDKVHKAKMSA